MHCLKHLVVAAVLGLSLGTTAAVHAQAFPARPVRVVIPYAPGGGAELQTRLVAGKLAELWGQPVLVENRPGGGTTIAGAYVAKAPADGYTILSAYSSMLTAAVTMKDLPFDVARSLTVVSWLTEVPSILVVPAASPAQSVKELMDLARKSSRQLSFGSTGLGGTQHLNSEMVLLAAQAKGVHIPYKGTAEAGTAILSQQVDFAFVDNTIRPLIRSGKARALAVTSTKRWPAMPDVPTLQESIGMSGASTRNYYLVPAATPAPLVAQINAAVVKALRSPDLEEKVNANGYNIIANSSEEATRAYLAEYATYEKLVKDIGLKPE